MIQRMLLCLAAAVALLVGQSQAQLPGGKIAYLSAPSNVATMSGPIYVMDPDGGNVVEVAQIKVTAAEWTLFPITWSPDGSHLAYQSEKDIYAINVAGGLPVNLTNAGPDETNQYPAWSPDGTRIAFTSMRSNSGLRIYLMNADGSNPVMLLDGQAEMPAWSPDGRKIAFDVALKKAPVWHCEIDVMDPDGGNRVRVSEMPGREDIDNESASWSPDGSKIVFMSDRRYRHFDIWMVNADGTDPVLVRQVKTTDPQQLFPAWSPLPRLVAVPSALKALSWGQVKVGKW